MAIRPGRTCSAIVSLVSVAVLLASDLPRGGAPAPLPPAPPEPSGRRVAVTVLDEAGHTVSGFDAGTPAGEPCPVSTRDPVTGNVVSAVAPPWCDSISLRLGETPLTGRAVTEDGVPLGGAFVTARSVSRPEGFAQTLVASTIADAEGRFTVPMSATARRVDVSVRAAGFGGSLRFTPGRRSAPTVEIVGLPVERADLTVRLRCGEYTFPFGGVAVEVLDEPSLPKATTLPGQASVTLPGVTRSGSEDGGPLQVRAMSRAAGLVGLATVTWPPGGGPATVEVTLHPAVALRGRILVADGRPAAGLALTYSPGGDRAVTDADGSFRFDATPEGFLAGRISVATGTSPPLLTIEARRFAAARDGAVVLPLRRFRGRVSRSDGTPAAFARIFWRRPHFLDPEREPDAVADSAGRFALFGPAAGHRSIAYVQCPGSEPDRFDIPADGLPASVSLRRSRAIDGTVVRADGAPAPFALVDVVGDRDLLRLEFADARGRFRIEVSDFRAGDRLSADDEFREGTTTVDVPPGDGPVRLVLGDGSSRRSLAGRVTFPDGTPCGHAVVLLRTLPSKSTSESGTTTTGPDGRFLLPHCPWPPFFVEVSDVREGRQSRAGGIRFPTQTIEVKTMVSELAPIVVAPAPTVEGTVRDENGRPLPGVACEVLAPEITGGPPFPDRPLTARPRYRLADTTDTEGRYRIGVPRVGPHHALFRAPGHEAVEWRISTERAGEIAFAPGARLAGVVVDPLGRPVPGVRLHLEWDGQSPSDGAELRTDVGGRFERFFDPGRRVAIAVKDDVYEAAPIEVLAPVEFVLSVSPR